MSNELSGAELDLDGKLTSEPVSAKHECRRVDVVFVHVVWTVQ